MPESLHLSRGEAAALLGIDEEEDLSPFLDGVGSRSTRSSTAWASLLLFRIISYCQRFSVIPVVRAILYAFVPSFFRKSASSKAPSSPRKAGMYGHLDGLRGLAALFVFFFHSSYTVWDVRTGYNARPGFTGVLRLPFLRLLFAGDAMVSVFFIVSGFVLSLKPVRLMSAGEHDVLFRSITSTGFRRGIRLYAPCLASTFIILLAIQLGLYERTRGFATNWNLLTASHEFHMTQLPTFRAQVWDWCCKVYNFIHVWDWTNIYAGNIGYDVHLWTIPDEYRCSMVLLLTQVVIARASAYKRMIVLSGLVVFAASWGRWEMMCFWSGALLAELEIMWPSPIHADRGLALEIDEKSKPISPVNHAAWLALFVGALYLLSFPDKYPDQSLGYGTLARLVPPSFAQRNRFWQAIGAFLVALAINRTTILQRIFVSRPIKYLGKISFALYLMHGLMIHTVQFSILPFMWTITGRGTYFKLGLGYAMSQTLVTAITIYVADIFWMHVDLPSNRLCHWLEGLFFDKT